MAELARTIGAAGLWCGLLLLLTASVNARRGRRALDPSALLIAYPLFFLLQVTIAKLLDLGGLLGTPGVALAHLVAAGAAGAAYLAWSGDASGSPVAFDGEPDGPTIRRIALGCAVLVVTGLAAFSLLVPAHVWDVQAYHMPMVASYVQNGSLSPWPTQDLRQLFRVNGGELQMLNLALLARSDAWMALPNLLGLIVCLVASFELATRSLRRRSLAYLVVVLVLTAPQILYGSVSAKNDLVFTAVLLCSFYWVVHLATHRPGRGGLAVLVLAASAALAAATKVMGLNVLGAAGLALLALVLWRRLSPRQLLLFAGASVLVLLALVGDIYWRNLGRAQVPVGIRPGEVAFAFDLSNLVSALRFYLYDLSFERLVTTQIFEHDFSHYGYLFPFLLALGTLAGLRGLFAERREPALTTLFFLAVVLFLSVIVGREPIRWDQRFMIWMVPVSALLATSLARGASGRLLVAATSFAAALAISNVALLYTNGSEGIFARSASFVVARGELPRLVDVAGDRYAYKMDGFGALDGRAAAGDSILYVGNEDTWMYPAWGRRFTRRVDGVGGAEDARRKAASGTYAYLVIEADAEAELKRAACVAAGRAGYGPLVEGEGRSILQRGRTPPSAPERAGRSSPAGPVRPPAACPAWPDGAGTSGPTSSDGRPDA